MDIPIVNHEYSSDSASIRDSRFNVREIFLNIHDSKRSRHSDLSLNLFVILLPCFCVLVFGRCFVFIHDFSVFNVSGTSKIAKGRCTSESSPRVLHEDGIVNAAKSVPHDIPQSRRCNYEWAASAYNRTSAQEEVQVEHFGRRECAA